jgi:hypothetical protein
MQRRQQLLVLSLVGAAVLTGLLLAGILSVQLLANRAFVKTFLVGKTAQKTGLTLDYDRLEMALLPLPHLQAKDIQLLRAGTSSLTAGELAVYPRLLPLLRGHVRIRQLELISADVTIDLDTRTKATSKQLEKEATRSLQHRIRAAVEGGFGALAVIDQQTKLRLDGGSITLTSANQPDIRLRDIDAFMTNDAGSLSLNLHCRSERLGNMDLSGKADLEAKQAWAQLSLTGTNLRPLLDLAELPGGITTRNTQASIQATVNIDGPDTLNGRFDLQFPKLTVVRKDRQLDLKKIATGGTFTYADKRLALSVDTLKSEQPTLELTASARITPAGPGADRSIMEVNVASRQLDVAAAGQVTRAIAGDIKAIQTAFGVAREGLLTDAIFFAAFEKDPNRWRQTKMKAAGHVSQGRVTLPGIAADLERMDGEIAYEDQKVAFNRVSGHFKGATFDQLEATIDWEQAATLTIASPSVMVDAAPLFNWLSAFEGLSDIKKITTSVDGRAQLSKLHIHGPLIRPADWQFDIVGTPQQLKVASPLVPFEIGASGGTVRYIPGQEGLAGVTVDFLDGSLVVGCQAKGIVSPELITTRIDGTLGKEAITWLTTILPIPDHLEFRPPLDLSGINVVWTNTGNLSGLGSIKTGGGVEFTADFTHGRQGWHLRRIHFADGGSNVTASARKDADSVAFDFTGNIEKSTADGLLATNRFLTGHITGDFRGVINTHNPVDSTFFGNLEGQGLQIQDLIGDIIDVTHFSIEGGGDRLTIGPSDITFHNNPITVSGEVEKQSGVLTFDLNAKTDHLDTDRFAAKLAAVNSDIEAEKKPVVTKALPYRGTVHLQAAEFIYGGRTWTPLETDIRIEPDNVTIQLTKANLCGISTPGELAFSPRGMRLHVTPTATDAALQETAGCLWQQDVKADARYDLTSEINIPPTRNDPVGFMTGQMQFSSQNGRIHHVNVLMKIFSILNITEIFAGGRSDLGENGYGYSSASATAQIGDGKVQFNEILLDGNSLKITGQGSIDLRDRTVDIVLLAAPLKTVDRLVNKLPVIRTITGGTLITIPLRLEGKLDAINVVPVAPSSVGRGLFNTMGRVLKTPFKMVAASPDAPPRDIGQEGP